MRKPIAFAALTLLLVASVSVSGCSKPAEKPAKSGGSGAKSGGGVIAKKVDPAKLLLPADVEQLTGMTGLKTVPKDPSKGAGGDVNIATADGKLIVMLSYGEGDFYAISKSGPNFGRPEVGIGDEAYAGPTKDVGPYEYVLGVRGGKHGLVYASFLDVSKGGKPYLTIEQLKQLAKVALGRLG
jgi:hypothetical protein